MREHVDGLNFLHGEAVGGEEFEVAGEGGGVAADVD